MRDRTVKRLSTIHKWLLRGTNGRIGRRLVDNDMLLLTTTGAVTGQPHTVPLLYLRDDGGYVVIASYGGRARNPQWYSNLLTRPRASIRVGRIQIAVHARIAEGPERDELWRRVVAAYNGYAAYQRRTDRLIPIVVLTPIQARFVRRIVPPSSIARMPAIEVQNLVKTYGDLNAVDGVDLAIEAGEVFALLGPNGAGKTTTVEILEGHRKKSSGSVSVLGFDPAESEREFRERIGIVLQETAVEPELTVSEVLDVYGDVYPRRRPTGELIELVGLEAKTDDRIKTLSGGQQRRLELALGLVGDPDLIFLDEPTTGFDPSARRQAWSIVENLTSLGKTILLTTHYMDEAQALADRIAVIAAGSIVAEGTPDTLGGRQEALANVRFAVPIGVTVADMPFPVDGVRDGYITVSHPSPTKLLHELTSWAIDRNIELEGLAVERPTLEDIYLGLVGEDSRA